MTNVFTLELELKPRKVIDFFTLFQVKPIYEENDRSLMLYACGWQEPDSIPSNVVIRNKKKDKHDQAAGCGAGAGKFSVCCSFR